MTPMSRGYCTVTRHAFGFEPTFTVRWFLAQGRLRVAGELLQAMEKTQRTRPPVVQVPGVYAPPYLSFGGRLFRELPHGWDPHTNEYEFCAVGPWWYLWAACGMLAAWQMRLRGRMARALLGPGAVPWWLEGRILRWRDVGWLLWMRVKREGIRWAWTDTDT